MQQELNNKRDIDVVFITCEKYAELAEDDRVVKRTLEQLQPHLQTEIVVWSKFDDDTQVNNYFSHVKLVIIRSPWDYVERFDEFMRWLGLVHNSGAKVLNTYQTITWNCHKVYLKQLRDECDIKIVPTFFFNCDDSDRIVSAEELLQVATDNNWETVILKPCKSAGSVGVIKRQRADLSSDEVVQIVASKQPYMLQPFVESISSFGEASLLFFNGEFSNAFQKSLKPGKFRWQNYTPIEASPEALNLATSVMESARRYIDVSPSTDLHPILYARVDMLQDIDGSFMLGELEVFEPDLYFRFLPEDEQPEAIAHLASTICNWLQTIE